MNKTFFVQALKYGIVGVGNTLLTLGIIWLMRDVFGTSLVLANIIGYVAGFINSFVLNRSWTFQSKADWRVGFIKFFAAFVVCYLIQLGFVLFMEKYAVVILGRCLPALLDQYVPHSEAIHTILGNVVYTGINFILNKFFTFRNK